ncbi:hypothetical protein CRU92_00830 [Arcobacter sp. FW59]|nr:hypothetical protein CRU92_00830 [Arcobacter sp. FW59]
MKNLHLTKHNGLNIGAFRSNQRKKFKQLKTEDERQAMIKEFECISPVYLFDENEVFKKRNIEATLDFCKKFAYEKLKQKTKHNGLNLGSFRVYQRKKFKTLKTEDERQAMIKEFECISPVYLFDEIELYKQRNIEATLDFCKKFGYEKLIYNPKHNGINLGTFRSNQKTKFKQLKTEDERQAMIKEFECISPVYLFDENEVFKKRNIEATLDFCKKFGYEKLKSNTKHNGLNIGSFRSVRKQKFKQIKTEDEQQALIKEFECISSDYLL